MAPSTVPAAKTPKMRPRYSGINWMTRQMFFRKPALLGRTRWETRKNKLSPTDPARTVPKTWATNSPVTRPRPRLDSTARAFTWAVRNCSAILSNLLGSASHGRPTVTPTTNSIPVSRIPAVIKVYAGMKLRVRRCVFIDLMSGSMQIQDYKHCPCHAWWL